MRTFVLLLLALACCGEEALVRKLGSYTVTVARKFAHVEVGKDASGGDGLTLADEGGLAIHLVFLKARLDVEAMAKEDAVPAKLRGQVKPVTTPLKANGLEGARATVAYQEDGVEVVTELGILGKEGAWVHWQIDATRTVYDAEAKAITAIIQSIK
jgi:hypothetical protein